MYSLEYLWLQANKCLGNCECIRKRNLKWKRKIQWKKTEKKYDYDLKCFVARERNVERLSLFLDKMNSSAFMTLLAYWMAKRERKKESKEHCTHESNSLASDDENKSSSFKRVTVSL